MNKIYIITGHYGSGKSEFSINFARRLKSAGKEVCLADLDIVNPYFRSRENREQLRLEGIDLASDTLNSTKGLDMPYLSPAIQGQLAQKVKDVILDCGGDDVGIRVLKQFYETIKKRDYEMYMIINTYRPETSNALQIINMQNKLEAESGLKITGYVNNSNFLKHTTKEDLIAADAIIKEVSQQTGIPIVFVSGIEKMINQLPEEVSGERFPFKISLRSDWM